MNRCKLSYLLKFLNEKGLKPNKSLSQNFLVDMNIVKKIVDHLELNKDDYVLEIGPGAGALTERLSEFSVHLTCVEKDKNLSKFLEFDDPACHSFKVVNQDIMLYDLPAIEDSKKWKIISNLPYHLTSKIIKKLAKLRNGIDFCILMVEKGYADDLINAQKNKQHDATSFILHHAFEISVLFPVSKTCFYPKPKIDSSIIKLKPKMVMNLDEEFISFIEIFFNQKRKMIQSILKASFESDVSNLPEELEVYMKLRPEVLSKEDAYKIFSFFYSDIKKKIDAKKDKYDQ